MNYILIPSLEHIAIVKIAITLWNQDDIKALTREFSFPSFLIEKQEKWQEIEDKVIEKLPQLPQPEALKEEILGFIQPIGLEILSCMEYHKNYLGIDLPGQLCWTLHGTVDKKKTAKALIRDERLDITRRYRLACIYCLENDIRELWNSMPKRNRAAFYNERHPRFSKKQRLVVLWTYDIKGEVAKLNGWIKKIKKKEMSPYQFAFEYAAASGYKAATEYFFQKLTRKERGESLVSSAVNAAKKYDRIFTSVPEVHYPGVLWFLLSQMDEEQQTVLFKSHPVEVLECLLNWPLQRLFMETVNRMWDFLSVKNLADLLQRIIDKARNGCKNCNNQKLFAEFWQQIPVAHRRHLFKERTLILLSELFEIKDEKNIKLILKDATLAQKETIIFSNSGLYICYGLMDRNEWDFLEFFIRECLSSKNVMIEFKEEFEKCVINRYYSKEMLVRDKDELDKFNLLLDNCINGYDTKKRTVEEGERSAAKSLRSIEFEE